MRYRRSSFTLALLAAISAVPAAQPQSPQPDAWAVHRAIRVKPEKRAEFEKYYRDTIKKLHQARKDAGAEQAWTFLRLVHPNGEEAPYNYSSTALHSGFPPLDQATADLVPFAEKAGTTAEQIRTRLSELGTLVRTMVTRRLETLGAYEPGDFVRVDYMKVAAGRAPEYLYLERTMFKPLHEQRIKDGVIKSWGLSSVVLPGGSERPFDFFTINVVKDNASLGRMNAGYGAEAFAKVHPGGNYLAVSNRTGELRTIVRSYLFRVLEVVR